MKNVIIIISAVVFQLAIYPAFDEGQSAIAQNIGINTTGATPAASSMLDIDATTGGLLIPRMTTVQRNAINGGVFDQSLLIYNTDVKCLQVYIGTTWQNIFCDLGCSAAPATPGAITGNTAPCQNATGITYSIAQVSGATSYSWSAPTGATFTGQGTTGIVVTYATTSGNITVTASNNCGTSAAQTLAISLTPVPTSVTASASPNPICAGSTLILTGGATGAAAWSWTGPNTYTSALQSPTIVGITTAGAGVYTLTVSNTCGSATPVNTASLTVDTVPAAPTTATHTPSQTQIVWNWNTVAGAIGYKYNTANNYGTATDNGASTSYTQTGLTCNIAYTLYVWAYNSCGNSSSTALTQTTSSCVCVPGANVVTFSTVGSTTWIVPGGVNCITVDLYGGGATISGPGGKGGRVQTTLATTPGETLYIYVGGAGAGFGAGGYNGGGAGGGGAYSPDYDHGGGGATDVRQGGFALGNRVIVGGGGGGAGSGGCVGAVGGGTTGGNGNTCSGGGGGGGGTPSAGGALGAGFGGGVAGTNGSSGNGGNGGSGITWYPGGGGGGGYYGGGGGGGSNNSSFAGGGGGGGSSYAGPGTSSTTHTQGYINATGNGQIIITW